MGKSITERITNEALDAARLAQVRGSQRIAALEAENRGLRAELMRLRSEKRGGETTALIKKKRK